MGARLLHRLKSGNHHLIPAIFFLVALGMLGGASRADELQQFLIRGAAILAIGAALWPLNFSAFRDARGPVLALALAYILVLAQLVPLPPSIWARMPGHALYAAVAGQTGPALWRPWTISPDLTLNSLASLLPVTAMGLLALAIDFRGRLLLARILVGIACASALLGLMQFAAGESALQLFRTTSQGAAVGLFANRNHQAAFIASVLPIGGALAGIRAHQEVISPRNLLIEQSAAILLLMGLGATGSRMGLLLGLIGIVAAAITYFMTVRAEAVIRHVSGRMRLVAAGFGVAALVTVSALLARSGAVSRLASDPVDQTRVAALNPMFQAMRAFLPFGAGFGTFDPVYRRFEPDALLSTIYLNQAHNEPVQLAIEGGIPALLLLLMFFGWWAFAAVRAMRPRGSSARRAMGMAMTGATLILMLSSLVDYPLRTPLLSGLFAVACVELVRSKRRLDPSRQT